jgi:hypothetical protein
MSNTLRLSEAMDFGKLDQKNEKNSICDFGIEADFSWFNYFLFPGLEPAEWSFRAQPAVPESTDQPNDNLKAHKEIQAIGTLMVDVRNSRLIGCLWSLGSSNILRKAGSHATEWITHRPDRYKYIKTVGPNVGYWSNRLKKV